MGAQNAFLVHFVAGAPVIVVAPDFPHAVIAANDAWPGTIRSITIIAPVAMTIGCDEGACGLGEQSPEGTLQ